MSEMLTVKELQAIFKCSHNKIYQIIAIKGFPVIKIGKQYYVSQNDLERWLDKNKGNVIPL